MRLAVTHILLCAFSVATSERHRCLQTDEEEADQACEEFSSESSGETYYYDQVTGKCKTVPTNACPGLTNRFSSEAECNETCKDAPKGRCALKPNDTYVKGYFSRWYFNVDSNRCEKFIFGRETGNNNENMFQTKVECEQECRYPILGICGGPKYNRSCNSTERRYRFNDNSRRCESYRYCGHNHTINTFNTLEACYKSCGKFVEDNCTLPIPEANCTNVTTVYGYNPDTQVCESYKGCRGERNAYKTAQICWSHCRGHSSSRCVRRPSYWTYVWAPFRTFFYDIEHHTCNKSSNFRFWVTSTMNRFVGRGDCRKHCKPTHKQNERGNNSSTD